MKKRIFFSLLTAAALIGSCAGLWTGGKASAEPAWASEAGEPFTATGTDGREYSYYLEEDGTYSAPISADEDVTWLYAECIGRIDRNGNPVRVPFWFGLSNFRKMDGTFVFEPGSRFSVRLIGKGEREEYEVYRRAFESRSDDRRGYAEAFCELRVTKADGTEYHDLGDLTELFVKGSTLLAAPDETLTGVRKMLPMNGITCPAPGEYTVVLLSHLDGVYAFDNLDGDSGTMLDEADPLTVGVLSALAGAAVSAVVCVVIFKKREKKEREARG